jgi:hypothetical protein
MTHLRQSAWKKALLAFALGSFGVLLFAQAASATHQTPVGASPLRVSLVPAYAQCTAPDQAHNLPLGFPSCSTASGGAVPRSSQVIWGPSSIGFARLVVCNAAATSPFCNPANPPAPNGVWAKPDIRITASIIDLRCRAGTPNCPTPGTSPYNPNAAASHYTTAGTSAQAPAPPCFPSAPNPPGATNPTCSSATADATLTAQIPGNPVGTAIRITDHNNPSNPGTMTDSPFPVPVDCFPAAPSGANCGVNTTANALVGGAVITGTVADIEIGQAMMIDQASNPFAVQGLFNP